MVYERSQGSMQTSGFAQARVGSVAGELGREHQSRRLFDFIGRHAGANRTASAARALEGAVGLAARALQRDGDA
jgi:hypothetical protein